MPRWEAIVLVVATSAMGGWWAGKALDGDRSGFIVVTTVPADATVLIDGVGVGGGPPVVIDSSRARTGSRSCVTATCARSERGSRFFPGRFTSA